MKQMVGQNKDIVGGGCVKDKNGSVVVDELRIRERWKEHFEKLLNEEFDWEKVIYKK